MSRRQKYQPVAAAAPNKRASFQVAMSWPCVITISGTTTATMAASGA